MLRRNSLPKPPGVKLLFSVEGLDRDTILKRLANMNAKRNELLYHLSRLNLEFELLAEGICGPQNDLQDVEFYDGTLGVDRELVARCEPSIGRLQWLDLEPIFNRPGDSPGEVSGIAWGSGGLIGKDLFLTASHSFDSVGSGLELPSRQGNHLPPTEIARLMHVNFNFQINAQTRQRRVPISYPVIELLEYHEPGNRPDYGIVRLGRGESGELPGDRFRVLPVALQDITVKGTTLCLIQHPNGLPKMIEAGPMSKNTGFQIQYDDIDTRGASSGAPLLSEAGEIVGVHTNGGCTQLPGSFNYGVPIEVIRTVSSIL